MLRYEYHILQARHLQSQSAQQHCPQKGCRVSTSILCAVVNEDVSNEQTVSTSASNPALSHKLSFHCSLVLLQDLRGRPGDRWLPSHSTRVAAGRTGWGDRWHELIWTHW